MKKTFEIEVTFEVLYCADCNMPYGLSKRHIERLRESGETFYCPSGHRNVFRISEIDKAKEEIANLKRDLEWTRQDKVRAQNDAEHYKNSRNALKGQITKIKQRVGGGKCPCCNRNFAALREHMAAKHPKYRHPE